MSPVQLAIHLFLPHASNNQKAKLLHSSTILSLTLIVFIFQLILQLVPHTNARILGYAANIAPSEVIRLTNEKRQAAGLPALTENPKLSSAARAKGAHMLALDYWAHIAPDGTNPWKFFKDAGYTYRYAGENLAKDFSNPGSAVEAWMASPTHRENLMSPKYAEIGIAVVEGDLAGVDTTIIVQLFGTSAASAAAPVVGTSGTAIAGESAAVRTPAPATPRPTPGLKLALATPIPTASPFASPAVLVSPFSSTKSISLAVVGILLVVLVIDGLVVSRRRIERIGGRTIAHIAFLGLITTIALLLRAGKIL